MAQETESVRFAFGTGEITPLLAARTDIEKTSTACRTVQNMTLGVYGYAERRAGSEFIARTKQSEPAGSSSA